MILTKIFGFDIVVFFIICIFGFMLLGFAIFAYSSVVFVGKKHAKIIERANKNPICITNCIKFILPIRDKVVAKVILSERTCASKQELIVVDKKGNSFAVNFSYSYKVNDALKFYYSTETAEDLLFNSLAMSMIKELFFNIQNINDVYSSDFNKLIKKINGSLESNGVEIKNVILVSIRNI